MNLYTADFRELLMYLYRRIIILTGKLLSRKGVVLVLSTVLLCLNIIDQQTWFFVIVVLLCNIGGAQLASILRKG